MDVKTPTTEQKLMHFWSVRLPIWLDPWAPRLADAVADGAWSAAWRGAAAYAPLAALAVGFLTPLLWPGMHQIYSESLLFMILVIAGAILSGAVGVMVFVGYVIGVLIWSGTAGYRFGDYPFHHGGSLLISYLLLAIPAVIIPLLARGMADEASKFFPSGLRQGLMPSLVLFPVTCALLVFLWAQAMVLLIRPLFTWVGRSPLLQAIAPVQTQWKWLVASAFVAAIVRLVLESRVAPRLPRFNRVEELVAQREAGVDASGVRWERIPAPVKVGLTTAVITLLLAGTYDGWTEALIVAFVVLMAGAFRAGLIGKTPRWIRTIADEVPELLKLVAAVVIGYAITRVAVRSPLFGMNRSFRGIMLGALITAALLYLFSHQEPSGANEQAGGPTQ